MLKTHLANPSQAFSTPPESSLPNSLAAATNRINKDHQVNRLKN